MPISRDRKRSLKWKKKCSYFGSLFEGDVSVHRASLRVFTLSCMRLKGRCEGLGGGRGQGTWQGQGQGPGEYRTLPLTLHNHYKIQKKSTIRLPTFSCWIIGTQLEDPSLYICGLSGAFPWFLLLEPWAWPRAPESFGAGRMLPQLIREVHPRAKIYGAELILPRISKLARNGRLVQPPPGGRTVLIIMKCPTKK